MLSRLSLFIALLLTSLIGSVALGAVPDPVVSATLNRSALPPGEESLVAVVIEIPDKLHAQSHTPSQESFIPLTVTATAPQGIKIGQPRYPPGEEKTYPALGLLNVYEGRVIVHLPVSVADDAPGGAVAIEGSVNLQLCDDSICYRPQSVPFTLATTIAAKGQAVTSVQSDIFEQIATEPIAWGWFVTAFIAGLIFNLMPCVLPVLPLKAIGFYNAAQHSRLRSVGLAIAFSIGILAIFAVLAVLILVTGQVTWGQQFSNPYFVWTIVAILLVAGLWLMGLVPMRLPTFIYNVETREDTAVGNVAFGALTAILSTPCTAPLFAPLLLWAKTQPNYVGVPAMLTVGLGMAFPYLILSAFPQLARKMPQAGPWSELFKQMMGWLLIGSAVFFAAGRLIPGNAFLWSLVLVATIAAAFMVMRTISLGARRRGLIIASVLATLLPISTFAYAGHMNGLFTESVRWTPYSDTVLAEALAKNRPVLIKFTANWCANCQYIEATVFRDKQTIAAIEQQDILALKADLTHEDAPGSTLLKTLNPTGGIPLTAVYLPGAEEPVQLDSIYTTATLLQTLQTPGTVASGQ
jgi:thiol:disulfide interchange protein